jgi:outer membrane protein, heavy metal efflux system
MHHRHRWTACALLIFAGTVARAQRPVSRRDAVAIASARGPQFALIAADTARAAGDVTVAGVRLQPNLQLSYTGASPQYHLVTELPLDGALLRGQRLSVARAAQQSVRAQSAFNRATATFDTDVAYTRALAARARALLSRRNATDADSLRRFAEVRREAGDASELDVQLAMISSGQLANIAASDSVGAIAAVIDLQTLLGESPDSVRITLADSLAPPTDARRAAILGTPLRLAAAEANVTAADAQLALERRQRYGMPSLTAGFEQGDPTGSQPQALPLVGIALPLPIPGRNKGQIQIAQAERLRAVATLTLTRLASQRDIAAADRAHAAAEQRVARDQALLVTAQRVAAMALTAYREGASPLPGVLEARRNARDVMAQYIDDLAALWSALAAQRLVLASVQP